jgi:hypothetical protein
VIALPPLKGATNETVNSPLPTTTVGAAGAAGTVLGVAARDDGDAGLVPFAFVAVTVHVYDLPLVRPPTVIGEAAPFADPAVPPFDDAQLAA